MYNHFASLVYSSEWTTIFRNQWILSPEYAIGRYLVLLIHNRSYEEIENFSIFMRDVHQVDNGWIPDRNIIDRQENFLWGYAMGNRFNERILEKDNKKSLVVDLLHTGDGDEKIYFALRTTRNDLAAPVGKYILEVALSGQHMGSDFIVPLSINFDYPGGMELKDIELKTKDKRIGEVKLTYNYETRIIKNGQYKIQK